MLLMLPSLDTGLGPHPAAQVPSLGRCSKCQRPPCCPIITIPHEALTEAWGACWCVTDRPPVSCLLLLLLLHGGWVNPADLGQPQHPL